MNLPALADQLDRLRGLLAVIDHEAELVAAEASAAGREHYTEGELVKLDQLAQARAELGAELFAIRRRCRAGR